MKINEVIDKSRLDELVPALLPYVPAVATALTKYTPMLKTWEFPVRRGSIGVHANAKTYFKNDKKRQPVAKADDDDLSDIPTID
jgi:hypothetical protein